MANLFGVASFFLWEELPMGVVSNVTNVALSQFLPSATESRHSASKFDAL
jgi:hypothetical protein